MTPTSRPAAPASPPRSTARGWRSRRVLLATLLLACLLSACRTQTADYFRDEVMPNDLPTKIVSAPVTLPVYILLTLVDIVIVNPLDGAGHVPRVVGDLWGWHSQKNAWIAYGALLPVKLVGTPVAAAGTTIFSEQFVYEAPR